MPLFLIKRLLTLIATLLAASVVVFWVLEILPGNAAQILMGPDASPEAVQALAQKLGLDQPPFQRYFTWVTGMLGGDLGNSYVYSTPVHELVLERLTLTVPLAVMAMILTTALALVVGVYAASHHNRPGDVGLMAPRSAGERWVMVASPDGGSAIVPGRRSLHHGLNTRQRPSSRVETGPIRANSGPNRPLSSVKWPQTATRNIAAKEWPGRWFSAAPGGSRRPGGSPRH